MGQEVPRRVFRSGSRFCTRLGNRKRETDRNNTRAPKHRKTNTKTRLSQEKHYETYS